MSAEFLAYLPFLAKAAEERRISEARLGALLTHDGLLVLLQEAAEGTADSALVIQSGIVLSHAWQHFSRTGRSPGGSPGALGAALSVTMAALRQGIAVLQLRAVPAAEKPRSVRRARRAGFLSVRPLTTDLQGSGFRPQGLIAEAARRAASSEGGLPVGAPLDRRPSGFRV